MTAVSSARVASVPPWPPVAVINADSVMAPAIRGGWAGSRGMTMKCGQAPTSSKAAFPIAAIGSSGVPSKQK